MRKIFGFALLIVFIFGLSLITSALNVFYRDMRYLVESGLTILFWLTPIFYPLSMVSGHLKGLALELYMLNPMANLITAYREALLNNQIPDAMLFVRPLVFALLAVLAGAYVFRRNAPTFADYL